MVLISLLPAFHHATMYLIIYLTPSVVSDIPGDVPDVTHVVPDVPGDVLNVPDVVAGIPDVVTHDLVMYLA